MKRYTSLLYSLLTGLLLVFAWPDSYFTALIFIAWIPLLLLADKEKNVYRFFLFCLLSMFIWNAGTTWWIWNSTPEGAIGAIIANSFLMCLPLWGAYLFNKKYGNVIGVTSFIVFWLSFEYIHLNWQLSWPWLTLGNVFATQPSWIQWYEITGVSGGSLWVLLVNILLFSCYKKINRKKLIAAVGVLVLPFVASFALTPNAAELEAAANTNVVIVQPNIDPYSEKFDMASTEGQIKKLIDLSEQAMDENTRLVLWPETALPVGVWQNEVQQNHYYQPVFEFVNRHPQVMLQTGIEAYKSYGTNKETITARKNESTGTYYDAFNSSVMIAANQPLIFYNKSKLVPGVETLPTFLMWLADVFEQFGGTTGGYGTDREANVFKAPVSPYVTAPIICYESIYGEYVTNYIHKGSNLLTIMTNDGWWANTPGHRQHLQYARLRAIETRKWVARSANTGISAVIDHSGTIRDSRPWDTPAAIKFAIPPMQGETFFVRNGALIFGLALLLMGALLLYNFLMMFRKKVLKK
ncbi:apolipoprotein N-acyltransferase [Aridibaculum aurantiacum]|uniref:apolipoprotein N-acyltransferase n=1 Tax=Aridibaculum aurantiacum TaxID=2810307 RepID=UPI001A970CEE|nr:apolipoprotein N-acyltransferase [Aridibaculum aurantiacum]